MDELWDTHNSRIDKDVTKVQEVIDKSENRADEIVSGYFDKKELGYLHLQFAIEKYWALQMPDLIKDLDVLYANLKNHEDNPKNFNDGDDNVYMIPHNKKKVIVYTTQSRNFLFVWEKAGWQQLHVRRFYDVREDPDDEWSQKELETFKNAVKDQGYKPAIIAVRVLDEYADDYEGNTYPERYSLNHYKNNGFEMQYGDGRDKGYIASYNHLIPKVDCALENHHLLVLITTCLIPHALHEVCGALSNRRKENT